MTCTHNEIGNSEMKEHEVDPRFPLLPSSSQDGFEDAQVPHETDNEDPGVAGDEEDVAVVESHVDRQRLVSEALFLLSHAGQVCREMRGGRGRRRGGRE